MSIKRILHLLSSLSLAALAACGDDDGSTTADAAPWPDVVVSPVDAAVADAARVDAPVLDAGPIDATPVDATPVDAAPVDAAPVDAGADAAPLVCSTSSSDYGDVGTVTTSAFFTPGTADPLDDIAWATAKLETESPSDSLEVELYAGYGVFAAGLAPGTYTIAGDDTTYATCGLCVMIKTNLVSTSNFEDSYLATSGTVTITQLGDAEGEQLALTLSDIVLEHVDIDLMTGMSTPASACTTRVGAASMSGTMQ